MAYFLPFLLTSFVKQKLKLCNLDCKHFPSIQIVWVESMCLSLDCKPNAESRVVCAVASNETLPPLFPPNQSDNRKG